MALNLRTLLALGSVCCLSVTALCQSYNEPSEPSPRIDTAAWQALPEGIHLTWTGKDSLLSRHECPSVRIVRDTTIHVWRGERIGMEALAFSSTSLDTPLSIQVEAPHGIETEFGPLRYVLTDDFRSCGKHPEGLPAYTVADVIDLGSNFLLQGMEVRPLWLTMEIPSTYPCGKHTLHLQLTRDADGTPLASLTLHIDVEDRILPPATEYKFHLDLWQQPYSVARFYGVEPWSEAHWALLRPYMQRLARAGQKVVSVILFYEPWGVQSNDKFLPMVETTKGRDGHWHYDYTIMDRWIALAHECGIRGQISCFSMIPWDMSFRYYDEERGCYDFIKCTTEDEAYRALWSDFLSHFAQHMKAKGWWEQTCIAMDERRMDDMMRAYRIAQEAAPGIRMALAGNYHAELVPMLQDYCIAYGQRFTEEDLQYRRAHGMSSTTYTCCTEERPNLFSNSQPCEAYELPLYCVKNGFDGYLHWSWLNWTDDPLCDTRFKLFAPGDTYFFYPGPRPSVRFERLIEGIEAAEKWRLSKQ